MPTDPRPGFPLVVGRVSSATQLVANAKRDPTKTTILRSRYQTDLTKRFVRLKGLVNETIVKNDALLLTRKNGFAALAAPAQRFQFTNDAGRYDSFMRWLNGAIDDEILEVIAYDGGFVSDRNPWQDQYIREAYIRGVVSADAAAAAAGVAGAGTAAGSALPILGNPIHAAALELLYTRQFEKLRGITAQMATQIGEQLASGIGQGLTNVQIAKMINARVDAIGIVRAKLIARTEIINAYATSTINRFRDLGLQNVTAVVEFASADDDRVCPECSALDGEIYTLEKAQGVIPVHPNCRCAWVPVIS